MRETFAFREGLPTAETVSDKLGIPVRTVREWLCDNNTASRQIAALCEIHQFVTKM